ncbi:hypothetical protein KY321_01065, partial [Candidatus Woesearchaeota archaeon]|nr:hypothetical protein [Candidatus Woesearchaeota archaeon]
GTNIGLILDYGDGTWDRDNNGIVGHEEGIDFELEPLFFDNFYDEYLCTLWETYNLEKEEIYSECYGSNKCCKFIGYDPVVEDWDEDYVLFKGEKNSGSKNIVIARIIYFDGTNVDYSNHDGLGTSFIGTEVQKQMNFTYDSVFKSENYFLKVTVDKDTFFHLKSIDYEIEDDEEIINDTQKEINIREDERQQEVLELSKRDLNKIFPKFTKDSCYYYIEDLFNTTKLSVNNNQIIVKDIIIKEEVLHNVWFKVELKNNNDSYQSLKIDSNYYNKAFLDFQVPLVDLGNDTVIVDNNVEKLYPVRYKEDETFAYFRVESQLEDLNFNIIDPQLSNKYLTGLNRFKLSPITYFLTSVFLAIVILLGFSIPLKVYEKYKAFRFVEKEVKVAEKFIKKEEKKAEEFIKKEEKIIISKFKKKAKKKTSKKATKKKISK